MSDNSRTDPAGRDAQTTACGTPSRRAFMTALGLAAVAAATPLLNPSRAFGAAVEGGDGPSAPGTDGTFDVAQRECDDWRADDNCRDPDSGQYLGRDRRGERRRRFDDDRDHGRRRRRHGPRYSRREFARLCRHDRSFRRRNHRACRSVLDHGYRPRRGTCIDLGFLTICE